MSATTAYYNDCEVLEVRIGVYNELSLSRVSLKLNVCPEIAHVSRKQVIAWLVDKYGAVPKIPDDATVKAAVPATVSAVVHKKEDCGLIYVSCTVVDTYIAPRTTAATPPAVTHASQPAPTVIAPQRSFIEKIIDVLFFWRKAR